MVTNGRPRQLRECPRCGNELQLYTKMDGERVLACLEHNYTEPIPVDQLLRAQGQPELFGLSNRSH